MRVFKLANPSLEAGGSAGELFEFPLPLGFLPLSFFSPSPLDSDHLELDPLPEFGREFLEVDLAGEALTAGVDGAGGGVDEVADCGKAGSMTRTNLDWFYVG